MDKIGNNLPELFYDLIGIFLPGFYLYFCFSLLYDEQIISKLVEISFLNKTISLIFIIYIIGHVIYTIGSFFIAKLFSYLFGSQTSALLGQQQKKRHKILGRYLLNEVIPENNYFKKNIEKNIQSITKDNSFDLSKSENVDYAFEFCRNYIMEKAPKRGDTIRKEQAYGEMSRGIVLVSLLCIIWLIEKHLFISHIPNFWYIFTVYFTGLVCFSYRYAQARYINPIFIFSSFCSTVEIEAFEKNNIIIQNEN